VEANVRKSDVMSVSECWNAVMDIITKYQDNARLLDQKKILVNYTKEFWIMDPFKVPFRDSKCVSCKLQVGNLPRYNGLI
jgi:hypothetical protein